jgi:hypothetical protein
VEDDGFAPQFAQIRSQNAALQAAINAENVTRAAADAVLTTEMEATLVALNLEIATRTAQDALLLALVNAEVAARTAAQLALNNSLAFEIFTREAFDTLAFAELANLTTRLEVLTAYDVFAQQEVIEIYNNLTLLEQDLFNETVARIAAENILAAQQLAQENFIILFSAELAAEIATRTAEGASQLAQIAAFLGHGILTINNQSSLNHNFNFVVANGGFVISSGGTNIINIHNHAITTIDGIGPAPGTFDISILANGNMVMTPGVNSLTFGLAVLPPPLNVVIYSGSWVAGTTSTCPISNGNLFQFDAFNLSPCVAASLFITNYNTPPPYAGTGWEVPLSGGGVPYGVWLVRVTMTLTVQYSGDPAFGVALSMGLCVNTRSYCISVGGVANEPEAALVWMMFESTQFTNNGLNYQDHTFKATYVFDGQTAAPGTGIFPVWQNAQTPGRPAGTAYLTAISVEYDVTQLA